MSAFSSLWPVHPKPLPDELLSSWLARIAQGFGQDFSSFCASVWPGQSAWLQDVDLTANQEMLTFLGRKTGFSDESVADTTLHEFKRLHLQAAAGAPLLLTRGPAFDPDRRFLRFCPSCLREDRTVYFRRRWRLAFYALCEVHGTRLLDGCGNCGRRVDLARSSGWAESLAECAFCGTDLRHGTESNSPQSVEAARLIGFQQRLLDLVRQLGKEESSLK
jgi:hypothetical protein